jgi:hypothetical protein
MSLLQPFPRPVGDVGLGAFSAEDPAVTLQDLVQLDVRVTWDEAVSIAEELCEAAQGLVMRPIPAAGDIILNANGTLAIRQSAPGVPDPVEAARRLHELLAGSVAPAPLRLFVSQAVSSGAYSSLAEFSDALAYYAKPGRQERVKAVYQRASEKLMLKQQSAIDPARPNAAAVPPPPHETSSRAHQSRRQLVLIGLATGGLASIVFGLGLYFWPSASSTSSESPATEEAVETATETAATSANAAAAPAARRAPAASRSQSAAPRTSSALDAAQIPLTGSRAASRYTGGSGGSRQGTRPSAGAAAGPAATPVAAQPAGAARTDAARVAPAQQTEIGAPSADDAPAVDSFSPTPIYSASDATVQPAVLSRPQLLPPPFGGGTAGKPVRMELVISPAGTVERARFLDAPQRMTDMMLLSSAKTWRFTPAVKDGQPVRYRAVLSWVAAP